MSNCGYENAALKLRKAVIAVMAINRMRRKAPQALTSTDLSRALSLFKDKPFVSITELVTQRLTASNKPQGYKNLLELLA